MIQIILNLWRENETLLMIIQKQIMMQEMKLALIQVLKSNICDYNDTYILVRCDITITAAGATQVAFKNCAPFTKCITKIDGTTIDDAEDLDLVRPMYNVIEYSPNYSKTTGSLWFHLKDEATDSNADIANTSNFKSLMYKANYSKTLKLIMQMEF